MPKVNLLAVLAPVGAALVATGLARPAQAVLTLTLSEPGFAPLVVPDGNSTGTVSYIGGYGDFLPNIVAGVSNKNAVPVPASATLQLTSINITSLSSTPGQKLLTISLSDDGYAFPGPVGASVLLSSSFAGTLTNTINGDSVTFQSAVLAPPVTDGSQTFTAPTSAAPTSFNLNYNPVVFARPSAYTLVDTITLSLNGGGGQQANLSGTTTVSAVPEPATAGLLLVAAAGTLAGRRRRTA